MNKTHGDLTAKEITMIDKAIEIEIELWDMKYEAGLMDLKNLEFKKGTWRPFHMEDGEKVAFGKYNDIHDAIAAIKEYELVDTILATKP